MILRLILVAITSLCGYYLAGQVHDAAMAPWIGIAGGLLLGALIIAFEQRIAKITIWELLGGISGLILGLIVSNLFALAFLADVFEQSAVMTSAGLLFHAVLGYLGLALGMKKVNELDIKRFKLHARTQAPAANYKILDTSVIIDGRIFDICETGFIEGILVIPQFVLRELMRIADSADPLRRTRGKRRTT
jgi:uncharacterized protein YacL